jgi:hypothetical protein
LPANYSIIHLGHKDACDAGVLHRDISVGNNLIVGGRGILIDWDLSKGKDQTEARQPRRTVSTVLRCSCHYILTSVKGTWQFMSAALVKNKHAPHTSVDDLESAFYVILWLVLMYSPSSLSADDLTSFVQGVLNPEQYGETGGSTKADFLKGRSSLTELAFDGRPLLNPLLEQLSYLFAVRYEAEPTEEDWNTLNHVDFPQKFRENLPAWKYRTRSSEVGSHQHVIDLIRESIKDEDMWPSGDRAVQRTLIRTDEGKRRETKTDWDLSDRSVKKARLE